jgi:hypothetical protein
MKTRILKKKVFKDMSYFIILFFYINLKENKRKRRLNKKDKKNLLFNQNFSKTSKVQVNNRSI